MSLKAVYSFVVSLLVTALRARARHVAEFSLSRGTIASAMRYGVVRSAGDPEC